MRRSSSAQHRWCPAHPKATTCLAALGDQLIQTGAGFIGGAGPERRVRRPCARVRLDRHQAIRDEMRGLVPRTPTAALHVHVGMPDPETAIDVCNRLRAHLPLLQALAAHSPFWLGQDSGLASAARADFRALPALHDPARRSRAGSTTRRSSAGASRPARSPTTRTCGGTSGRARSWARSRSARWTRRAGWSPWPGSPRSSTRSPSPARTAGGAGAADRGARNPRSAPPATGWTRRSGGAARPAGTRGGRGRARARAPVRA